MTLVCRKGGKKLWPAVKQFLVYLKDLIAKLCAYTRKWLPKELYMTDTETKIGLVSNYKLEDIVLTDPTKRC